MQPYDYTIQQPRMPDLMNAMQQGQQMRANRQAYQMNQMRIQEIEDAKRQEQGLKSAMADLLNTTGGDYDKAAQLAPVKYGQAAPSLIAAFNKMKADQYGMQDLDTGRQKTKLEMDKLTQDLQGTQRDALIGAGVPMIKKFLQLNQGERLDAFRPFTEAWKTAGLPVDPKWVDEGYTLGTGQELESMAKMEGSRLAGTPTPANLQTFEAVKNMSPEERQLYFQTARSPQYLDLGTHRYNPLTGESLAKEVPIQDQPFFKQLQSGASERGKLETQIELQPQLEQAKDNMAKIPGAKKVVNVVNTLRNKYDKLRELGGIVDLEKSSLENIMASGSQSSVGQAFQRIIGSDAQSIRNEINTLRTWGLLAIKDAANLGTTSMNTAKEMEVFLSLATDPKGDFQSNIENLKMFEEMYGKVLQTPPGTYKNNVDAQTPSTLTPEKQKRLEELRAKKAAGQLQ